MHTKISNTLAVSALQDVYQHLSETGCPQKIIDKILLAQSSIRFENDPGVYWDHWVATHGQPEVKTPEDAKALFVSGFRFCQEEMEYIFGKVE